MELSNDTPEIEGGGGSADSNENESRAFHGEDSPRRQSVPALAPDSAAIPAEEDNDRRWLESWARNENRWLRNRAEELEGQLRRRTLVLGGALVLSGLTAVAAVGLTIVRFPGGGPEPPRVAAFEPAPPSARAAGPPSGTTVKAEQASGIGPPRTDQPPAVAAHWDESDEIDGPATSAATKAAAEQRVSGPMQAGSERPKRLLGTAQQSGDAIAVSRSSGAPMRQEPAQVRQQQAAAIDHEADADDIGDLRAALAATKERIEELEAAGAEYEARVAELRVELEDSRAEARTMDEQLAASRRGIERLNTVLATATAIGPAEAGAKSEVRADSPAAPPGAVAAYDPAPGADGGEASVGGAAYYAAMYPVNLRAAPRNAAEVLAVVEPGDVVRRIGRERGWLQVDYTARRATAITGWVHSRHLRPTEAPPQGSGTSARVGG